ncbi:MAG: hypothetical protein H7067_11020, partial [Burkholderiales bacterium]|nr:hypothetical protein [Opitutaceae bacterium]
MIRPLLLASFAFALAGCVAADASRAKSPVAPARLAYDFNTANPWSAATTTATGRVKTAFDWAPVGTYDTRDSDRQSPALRLSADATGLDSPWRAALRSGPLPVALGETRLGKLTLAFDLAASSARPVTVTVRSLDSKGRATGALEGVVLPAAPGFIHRHTLDLDTLKPVGRGKFAPSASALELVFTISGETWPAAKNELHVDNVALAAPALYVAPSGSDSADGRTEATALATPQRALDLAQPGDIIVLRAGTYNGG